MSLTVLQYKATESSTPQADYLNQPSQDPSAKIMLYRMAKLIKDQIKHCKGMSLYPVSVNDIDLATAKQIVPTDVYLFLLWVNTNDDLEADLESSCSIADDERRVLCLAQDLIHCASHGRVKLPKHVGLAMPVRHMTGSKQLVSTLNRMKPFGLTPLPKVHADHVRKEKSLTRINAYDKILECLAHGKRPNVEDFIGKLKPGGAVHHNS